VKNLVSSHSLISYPKLSSSAMVRVAGSVSSGSGSAMSKG